MALSLRATYHSYIANAQTGVVVIAGDLIIVGYSYAQALTTSTPTDNSAGGSNTYNSIAGTNFAATGGEIFYAIAKGSETLTITCAARSDNGLSVHVVIGANQTLAAVLDQSNTNSDAAGTNHTSASITNANANDYIFVLWYQEDSASTQTENGTSFTKQTEEAGHTHSTFDRIVAATGTYQDTITSSASLAFGNVIASFKAAAGAGVTTAQELPAFIQGIVSGAMAGRQYI